MENAVVCPCLLPVRSSIIGGRRISGQNVPLRYESANKGAIGAEEQDRVQGDEEGGEHAGNDGFTCDADIGADGGEEQKQGCDEGGGEGRAAVVFLLEDAGEDQGERSDADAGELVNGKRGVAISARQTIVVGRVEGSLRKREVAQDHLETEDDCQRQDLLGDLPVELEEPASRNSSSTICHPSAESYDRRLLFIRVPESSARGRHGVRRCDRRAQSKPAEWSAEPTSETRKAY